MSLKSELILITNRYPYIPGEEFLTIELEYLCEVFNKVHIIPINALNKSQKREVPSNVVIHDIFNRQNIGRLSKSLTALTDKQGLKWIVSEYKNASKHGMGSVAKLFSWAGTGILIRNYLARTFLTGKRSNTKFVFYSYWLSLATGLSMLKENNKGIWAFSRGHGGDIYDYRHSPPYLPLKKLVISNLNSLYVISDNGRQYLSEQNKTIEGKLNVARLGTRNQEEFIPHKRGDRFRIVSCSYLVPVKRLELVINALKKCNHQITWTHIGDGPEREKLESLSKGLPENVHYTFLGNKSNVQVFDLYKSTDFDLFINVSSSEGIPVSIMEAYSFGIPALATDVGGTSEIVNDNNGTLVPKDIDAKSLAIEIEKLIVMSEELYLQKCKNAHDTWENFYNADRNYPEFIHEISNVGDDKK